MWTNDIKIAKRRLWKRKASSLTKLISLILGTICLFYITVYVQHERGYDTMHSRASRMVKINTSIESPTGNLHLGLTAIPLGPYMKSQVPQVEAFVRISKDQGNHAIKYKDMLFSESENIYYADQSFLSVFDFPLLIGDRANALDGPNKIILTEKTAQKYFGLSNPINQILHFDGDPMTVSGVLQNIPSNSHLQFDFLISMPTFLNPRPDAAQNWGWFPMNTYLLLSESVHADIVDGHLKKIPQYLETNPSNDVYVVSQEPLNGLHFSEPKLGELGTKAKYSNLYILLGIGLMILLLAITNFVNLTIAQISAQHNEIAIQKTIGATRFSVFRQFFLESTLLTFLASIFSAVIILFSVSWVEGFLGLAISSIFSGNPFVFLAILTGPIVLCLLGGIYPALKFATLPAVPERALKEKVGLFNVRRSFLIFQFAITSVLLICALIIFYQLNYLEHKDLGMDTSQLVVVDYGPNSDIGSSYETLKQVFGKVPGVESVTFSSHVPGQVPNGVSTQLVDTEGRHSNGEINLNLIDHDFISNYGLELVAGRDFRGSSDNRSALILNESAVKAFGYSNPEDILGASFEQWGGNGTVVGVVKDFNYLSLHENIGLLSFKVWPDQFMKATFRISESRFNQTLSEIQAQWNQLFPDVPFNHYLVDDKFLEQYKKDFQFSKIVNFFTLISIGLGVLGLIAYANFWCLRRKKEMTIRKILGAHVSRLVWSLYKSFGLPILVGFVLAVPLAYYLGSFWLEAFAYRFSLEWHFFILPLLLLILLVWLSVGFQSMRLATSNPVDNLKEE